MSFFERLWDVLGMLSNGILGSIARTITRIFGSSNARHVAKMQERADRITATEARYQAMSDEELRDQTDLFRKRLRAGETLDDILEEAFAVCREGGRRFLGMRHYDVQLIGGMVLHSGTIAEMVTGEGKTLVATLPAYLNAIEGKGVHVVTVNDYLARRDMEWMAPLYMNLGLTVNAIQSGMSTIEKQKAYACDITYGTNNEFGFDYLRDNMRPAARSDSRFPTELQQSQGPLHFAIIDEVDNILIDEARTPLIISGPADMDLGKYAEADRVARQLTKDDHFAVDEKQHHVTLTDEGVREAERLAGVESFYTAGNMDWPHLIDNALKAHHLYKLDVNYVVKDRAIIIVDEFTGRLMEGRQWSDGLHQAVEAKEGVPIKQETQTFATITLQNFFKLYKKLSGMTGTAMTEANEFFKIYNLDVIAIPTNREMQRIEYPDVIYMSEKDKYKALADDVERNHKWDVLELKDNTEIWGKIDNNKTTDDKVVIVPKESREPETIDRKQITGLYRAGRPVLVGTVSIEKSERLSALLQRRGIKHEVLNAKQHGREAEIVAQAGRLNSVTIATNMAGRGTDIILGGNPETMAWAQLQHKYPTRLEVPDEEWNALVDEIDQREKMSEEGKVVREIGGLYVIGTERHESRRIDLQLRGRCGRQGDPGSSRFYLSLEDDLMRIFAGDFVKSAMQRLGMKEGESIESKMVSNRIASAQKKVEERNFEQRKSLLDYDEVMDEQRKRVYGYRQRILDGFSCRKLILEQIRGQINTFTDTFLEPNYGADSFAGYASGQLGCPLEPRDFRGMDYRSAVDYARDQAERSAETSVMEIIEENLPAESDEDEWNWQALATWSNTQLGTNYRDRDLQKLDRAELTQQLIEKAHKKVRETSLSEAEPFLEENFGLRSLCAWIRYKFGIEATPDEFLKLEDRHQVANVLIERAEGAYDEKEKEYPVLTGISAFTTKQGTQIHLDRDGLISWMQGRFGATLSANELQLNRDDLKSQLVLHSKSASRLAAAKLKETQDRVSKLFGSAAANVLARLAADDGAVESMAQYLNSELGSKLTAEELSRMTRAQMQIATERAVDDRYNPEMRRMERQVLLTIVDETWKNHLLAMDHLRSSVQLKSYAQLDPKVEYKREGMRLFEKMWESIGERATDLIFRMESFNEDFVRSTWIDARPKKDEIAASASPSSAPASASAHQRAAEESTRGDEQRPEPIRHVGPKVGRNDPCPCGSGKKYKACCLRKMADS